MDRVYLEWNLVNWITVVLMAAVGMIVIGTAATALRSYKLPVMTDPNAQG